MGGATHRASEAAGQREGGEIESETETETETERHTETETEAEAEAEAGVIEGEGG